MESIASSQQIRIIGNYCDPTIYIKEIEKLRDELSECQKERTKQEKDLRQLKFQQKGGKNPTNEAFEELNNKVAQLEFDIVDKNKQIERLSFKIQTLESIIENHGKKFLEYDNKLQSLMDNFDNYKKANDTKVQELQKTIKDMADIHMIYVGQMAYKFCKQAYYFVLGDQLYKRYHPKYFMDKLDGFIDEIQDKDQQEQALNNWENLKSKLAWKPEMAEDVKNLRQERNSTGHPKVEKAKALEAIKKLNEDGKLLGEISFSKINNILKMWEISCSLVPHDVLQSTY